SFSSWRRQFERRPLLFFLVWSLFAGSARGGGGAGGGGGTGDGGGGSGGSLGVCGVSRLSVCVRRGGSGVRRARRGALRRRGGAAEAPGPPRAACTWSPIP